MSRRKAPVAAKETDRPQAPRVLAGARATFTAHGKPLRLPVDLTLPFVSGVASYAVESAAAGAAPPKP
jgi:hypothetical protein